jgi:NAD+ synthase (glutamine-hydrolysing)
MHLAGMKIRQWRESRNPPLSAEEFGEKFGDPWPSRTVYGWEAKGKIARSPVQKRLAEMGICSLEDWLEPAPDDGVNLAGMVPQTKPSSPSGGTQRHPFYELRTHGFARVATCTPKVRPADVSGNTAAILTEAGRAHEAGADLAIFPELCVSSYAIDDLHLQHGLLDAVEDAIAKIAAASARIDPILLVGAPLRHNGRIYNCAVVVAHGNVLGIIPKSYLPNYREYYEKRWFAHGREIAGKEIALGDASVPFGCDLIFAAQNLPGFKLFVEICEDIWSPAPPSIKGALAGATVIANLSASNITIGKSDERHMLCRAQSASAVCAYAYSASGHGESTTDLAWDGQSMIYELGDLLAESRRFSLDPEVTLADVDCERIMAERLRMQTFNDAAEAEGRPEDTFREVTFKLREGQGDRGLVRPIRRFPFVPSRQHKLDEDCYEAFNIQVDGLIRRFEATHAKSMVIGISGGLDSTHALIVAAKCCDRLGLPRSIIRGYTMPGFGTSDHTKSNAWKLMKALRITAEEIDIRPAAQLMLEDMDHPFADGEPVHDVTFENVQAGLRTDYLFRLAGHHSGFVIGTGDLSELALGWCTYGVGDQMSHYAVNSGVPKTLIQYLIRWCTRTDQFDAETDKILEAILDTEISPELVPPGADGEIQSTESIIGPYELNDFFLHHTIRWGQRPSKIAFMAWHAWHDIGQGLWPAEFPKAKKNEYDLPMIVRWQENFIRRFFAFSQFKRSAIPNGPKVSAGGALSPRGDWRAPSDAVADVWLEELRKSLPDNP